MFEGDNKNWWTRLFCDRDSEISSGAALQKKHLELCDTVIEISYWLISSSKSHR